MPLITAIRFSFPQTSYNHFYHHAHATLKTGPIFTGFFFKVRLESTACVLDVSSTQALCR